MRNIVIFGDSPYTERLSKYILFEKTDNLIAYTQEEDYISRNEINGIQVIPFEKLHTYIKEDFFIIIGVGYSNMNNLKKKIFELCISRGYKVASYISKNAFCYTNDIGAGCFVCPGAIIGPNCKIGVGNFIASSAVLSHDNIIGDFNFISTNVVFGGSAKIGNHCFLGLHSTIKNSLIIEDYVFVGAGSNVLKSLEIKEGVYVGNPAKQLLDKRSTDLKI